MKKYILVLILCSVRLILIGQTGLELYLSTSHLPNSAKFNECIDLANARADKFKNSDFQGVINDANKILELYNYDPHHMDDLNNNNTYSLFCVAYEMRGDAKYDLKDYTGAIEDYEEHIRLNPRAYSNLDMWENIGKAKIKLKDYQGALTYINYSIDRNPDKPYGYGLYYRGVIKVFTNDLNGAISDFTYEIDKKENTDCYYDEKYFLARAYAKNLLGDKIGACEDIETVMKLFLGCSNRKDWCIYLTDFPNYDDLLDESCNSEFTYRELVEANTIEKINDLIKQHNDKTQASNNPTPTSTNSPASDRFSNSASSNSTSVPNTTNATTTETTRNATNTTNATTNTTTPKATNPTKSPSVPNDSPWTLNGKTSSKLIRKEAGKYNLKYKSEYSDNIYTIKLTRTSRTEENVRAHFGGDPMIRTFIGAFAPKEELEKLEPQVPAIIEVCKSDDPDYSYLIYWANVSYGDFPYKSARGYIIEFSSLEEVTNIWFIP